MKEPKGFTCECDEYHAFSVWVFAHWREKLVHTCEKCQAKHTIIRGIALLDKLTKAKKK